METKIERRDEVRTPEGEGTVEEESTIGEFRIHIPKVGFRWYFPEDIAIIRKAGELEEE